MPKIFAILLVSFSCSFAFAQEKEPDPAEFFKQFPVSTDEDLPEFFQKVHNLVQQHYYKPAAAKRMAAGIIKGLRFALQDPHVDFLDEKDYEYISKGKFKGLGLVLGFNKKRLQILSTIPASPAQQAGIQPGDVILAIDGEDAQSDSLAKLVARLRGAAGSKVTLKIHRPSLKEDLALTIVREEFKISQISHRLFDNIGYIAIKNFEKDSVNELRELVSGLQKNSVQGILIDLRHCNGGHLDEALQFADGFLRKGLMAKIETREENREAESDEQTWTDVPVVILISGETWSAGEVFAGALKDRGRAILVGTNTGGKGTIQKLFPLGKGALKLTIGRYLTPSGFDVEKKGIAPNIYVENKTKRGKDVQLQRGIEMIKALMSLQK